MYINNAHISRYGGELTARNIIQGELSNLVEWPDGSIMPVFLEQYRKFKKIEISIEMKAHNAHELEEQKSQLSKDLSKCLVKFTDIDLTYECYLASFDSTFITTNWNDLDITLMGICYGEKISISLEKKMSQEINIQGTARTPCIYEINALTSIIDFEINNIKVHDVPINTTLVIDGERCLILLDGKNKFLDTELTAFPYLDPGSNTIKMNNTNCEVKIKYKPRFV